MYSLLFSLKAFYGFWLLVLGVSSLSASMVIRGGFSAGGRAVSPDFIISGALSGVAPVAQEANPFLIESGVSAFLDYTYTGPSFVVISNPETASPLHWLSQGEYLFYAGNTPISGGSTDLHKRLPRVVKTDGGLLLRYQRSGSASLSMDWVYETSSDLINWTEVSAPLESFTFSASENLATVSVPIPAQNPTFVRIRLVYF
jgi:hypothetical protein